MTQDFRIDEHTCRRRCSPRARKYNKARHHVREINRDEPPEDEHNELREGLKNRREAARAEQKAPDSLTNAVASFAGRLRVPLSSTRPAAARWSPFRESQTG